MDTGVLLVHLVASVAMAALPLVFFRRDGDAGRFNLRWWLTSSPFLAGPLFIGLAYFGITSPLVDPNSDLGRALVVASVPFGIAATAMMCATMATHRIPLSLWHQEYDAPRSIVTYGPYRYVRHPFYSSFLIMLMGEVLYSPQVGTLAAFALAFAILNATAAREEARLSASEFGAEYVNYKANTGRFIPKSGGVA